MQTHPLKLVTIVAESTLEHRLTDALKELGATGFTVLEGRGEGSRGLHAAGFYEVSARQDDVGLQTLVVARRVERRRTRGDKASAT